MHLPGMHLLSQSTSYDDLTDVVLDAARGRPATIDPTRVAVDDVSHLIAHAPAADLAPDEEAWFERTRVAVIVWRIVAAFIADPRPLHCPQHGPLPGPLYGPLHASLASTGRTVRLAEVAERYVAVQAEQALGERNDTGQIILPCLDALSLADDFARMVRGDQADALAIGQDP